MTAESEMPAPPELRAGVFTPHMLVEALNRDTERAVLHMADGRIMTAGEMRDVLSTYLQAFEELGIRPGTRVGLLSKNRPEVMHAFNAASVGRLCIVPMHPMGSLDDYLYMMDDAGIEVLIYDPTSFDEQAAALKRGTPGLKHLLAFGPTRVGRDLEALAARYAPRPLVAPVVRADEVSRLSYSGGTTGKPKAIMTTNLSAWYTLVIMMAEWEWPAEIRHLVCAPLSHAGAAAFLPTLLRGGSLVVLPAFEPVAVLEAIERHRITSAIMVPTMIYALLGHPRFAEFDLSSLETIFYGASSISPTRLKEAIERIGPVFFQFYGQAEAPMTVTVLKKREHDPSNLARLASCGRPVPWVGVALLDDRGREVPDGVPGEICVRGPLLMAGYLNKPQQTAEAFQGGWLHTGDVAVKDPDGFLRIVDRKKDMIVTGGFNVFPREVEDVLSSHPAVASAAVIGVADEKWGEAVKAVVVLRPNASVAAEELISLVREKKGAVQAPKSVDFIDSIPLSGLGKPDKKALRARYARAKT